MANLLAALLVFSFGLGQTFKFTFFSPQVRFSPLDCIVLLLILASLATKFSRLKQIVYETKPLVTAVASFAAIATLSLILAGPLFGLQAQLIGGLYLFRWITYSLLPLSLYALYSQKTLKKILFLLGLSVVVTGLYQYLIIPDIRFLALSHWDPHYFRVVGSWLDPGFTGLLLVYFLVWISLHPPRSIHLSFVIWLTSFITLALTYSRSSYLAFLVSMGYIAWVNRSLKFLLLASLLFVVTISNLPRPGGEGVRLERTASVFARLLNWRNSLIVFANHPILGVGFNTYRYAQAKYHLLPPTEFVTNHAGAGADSSLLLVAATTGLIGLSLYLRYLSSLWHNSQLRFFLFPLLFHSLFLNSLFYPAVLLYLGLLMALTARTSR